MAFTDPGRYSNQREALRRRPAYDAPRPPKRNRIRGLVNAVLGRSRPHPPAQR
jgi:hypothetical protein